MGRNLTARQSTRLWLFLAISLVFSVRAFAACSGSSPNWTAASPAASDVQACINAASTGDTINVPSGSASWGASALTLKSGGNTFVGATVVTFSGTPGASGYSASATDNTIITLTADQAINATLGSGLTTFKNFTFLDSSANGSHGLLTFSSGSTFPLVGVRLAYNHFNMQVSDSVQIEYDLYGLIDHNFFDDQTSSSPGAVPLNCYGHYGDYGYSPWNAATQMGTNQSVVIEDNYYNTSHDNGEGLLDGYAGCRVTVRYNTINGNLLGGTHGTDSGPPYRSGMLGEYYNNYVNNPLSAGLLSSRGGILMVWGNTVPADGAGTPSVSLNYLRYQGSSVASGWGLATSHLNWINSLGPPASGWGGTPVTLNASNYQTSHTYAAYSTVINTNGCNMQTVSGGTTGSTQPSCPSFDGTVTDTGGVVWTGVGGGITASSLGAGIYGWCAANPDTACSANSTCSALSSGDTCSNYLDGPTPGGDSCGYRDQPGCGHNQILTPNYEWLNTGSGLPSPVFSSTVSICAANSCFYDYVSSGFNGTAGVGSGLSSALPSTCTPMVGFWETDLTRLMICTATNTWTVGYIPYTYPDPLEGTYTITISSTSGGSAVGTVTSSDSVLNCTVQGLTGTCTDSTASGTVTLTFTAASGYTLSSVTGCTLSGNTCSVTGTATVTASFTANPTGVATTPGVLLSF